MTHKIYRGSLFHPRFRVHSSSTIDVKPRVNRFAKTEKCHQLIHATLKIDFSHFVAINQFMASIDRFMRQKIRILHILTASIDSWDWALDFALLERIKRFMKSENTHQSIHTCLKLDFWLFKNRNIMFENYHIFLIF
jgi:hypothetical protein